MPQNNEAAIRRHLSRKCAALGIPVSGTFELTPRCNLNCKMCYVRLTPGQMAPMGKELTAEQWLALGREAKDAGMAFLLLTGGEPTLRRDFEEIYEGLIKTGFSITVNTNGTLLRPSLRALWRKYPPAYVNVTLYGACREDYEGLCGDADAFDRVMDTLHWLRQEKILTHLNTTIVPSNAANWERIEALAKELGFDLRMTAYCFPPVRRTSCADFSRLEPEQAASLIVKDMIYREGMDAIIFRANHLDCPPSSDCGMETGDPMQCMAGRSQFWIDWKGHMTPCGMLPEPSAFPMTQGFPAAWEDLRAKTAGIRLCHHCTGCESKLTCMNCAAVVYSETGSFTGKPEYMCRMNEEYRRLIREAADSAEI